MSEEMMDLQNSGSKLVRFTEDVRPGQEEYVYVGDTVDGVYVSRRDGVGPKKGTIYEIDTKEHGLLGVWSSTVLTDQMGKAKFNHRVIITYLGEKQNKAKSGTYLNFNVKMSKTPVVEMEDLDIPDDM